VDFVSKSCSQSLSEIELDLDKLNLVGIEAKMKFGEQLVWLMGSQTFRRLNLQFMELGGMSVYEFRSKPYFMGIPIEIADLPFGVAMVIPEDKVLQLLYSDELKEINYIKD